MADARALGKEWARVYKEVVGMDARFQEVATGTVGRVQGSADYENWAAWEATEAKFCATPEAKAVGAKFSQMSPDVFVANTIHDEFWRDD